VVLYFCYYLLVLLISLIYERRNLDTNWWQTIRIIYHNYIVRVLDHIDSPVRFISFRYKVSIAFRTICLVGVIGIYDTPCLAVIFPKLNHRTALSCPGFAKASPVASRLVLPPDDIHYTNRLTPRLRQKKCQTLLAKSTPASSTP